MRKLNYLAIEGPDTKGTIDFLGHRASVEAEVVGGKLYITIKASQREEDSSWDLHEFEVELPKADGGDDTERLRLRQRALFRGSLRRGDTVFWEDPGEGTCSGMYRVVEIYDTPEDRCEETIVSLANEAGSEVEVHMCEVHRA